MHSRRLFLSLAPASSLLALVACTGLTGPTVITLSEAELAGLIARSFPVQRRLLDLLDVQLAAPRLRLLPERNRLAVDLQISSQDRLFGQAGRGQLLFDSALRYEPRDATVRLTQVRVQQFRLDGGTAPAQPAASDAPPTGFLGRLGLTLAERVLDELALYTVSPERLASLRQLGLQPGAVTVTARGL